MNDTLWILLLVVMTGAGGRLAKLWPKLPKNLMPILVLALGAGLYILKATQIDGIPAAEALMSWQAILTGASAVFGHDLLKGGLLSAGMSEQLTTTLMGSLPKPKPKKTPPTDPPVPPVVTTVFVGLLALLLMGCPPSAQQIQAKVADTMAMTANQAKADLMVIYENEGDAAIPAPDRETSDEQVDAVRERWAPVWAGLKAFAAVHDQWATALEQGGKVDIEGVLAAFCKLVGLAKPWLALPDIPGAVCPKVAP